VVLAGSGLTAPMAWLAARLSGARCIAYVHGLDIAVPHPLYRAFWLSALRRMDRVIANSRATAVLAKNTGIPAARISIVHPGAVIPAPDTSARARFRAAHGLGDRPLLLSVGRLTRRKGLREFVADVLPIIVTQRADALLLVVGDAPANALYAEVQTRESIQAAAETAGVGAHLRFLGTLFGADLAAVYQAADVHVFPVRHISDDPEGFGMVAVEAAAHGLPTVAYATGGVVDAVAEGESGALLAPGDGVGFAAATLRLLAQPLPTDRVRSFAERFAWPRFGAALAAQIERLPR
jgi:phosphatidylinositol alpha-1,6-mannosyltransferase